MKGCLQRVGCLTVILIIAAAAWLFRDRWMPGQTRPRLAERVGGWEQATPAAAVRAGASVATLGGAKGAVFANVRAGELVAWLLDSLSAKLPPPVERPQAAILGDRVYIRSVVRTNDLGGSRSLGPLAALLGDRDTVQFGGTLRVIRPGLAEYRVDEVRVREFSLPKAVIPKLLRQLDPSVRPEGVSPDGVAFTLPRYVGDVRIVNGHVTLYRAMP